MLVGTVLQTGLYKFAFVFFLRSCFVDIDCEGIGIAVDIVENFGYSDNDCFAGLFLLKGLLLEVSI